MSETVANYLSSGGRAKSAGQLGYQLACLIQDFVQSRIEDMGELRFQIVTEVMGTLDSVARDFWSEVGDPYERMVEQDSPFRWGFNQTMKDNAVVDNSQEGK